MTVKTSQPGGKRRRVENRRSTRSANQEIPAEWRLADDQLDEALRQTFPASDALSMVQGGSRNSRFV